MTENQTSKAFEELATIFKNRMNDPTFAVPAPPANVRTIVGFFLKYQRMEKALETIAGMECMTFAECTDAETIMTAAKEALAFDPLK